MGSSLHHSSRGWDVDLTVGREAFGRVHAGSAGWAVILPLGFPGGWGRGHRVGRA